MAGCSFAHDSKYSVYRPIDVQSSDAGPGVSSHEKVIQIRMAEYFQTFKIDLQARVHYAPNDSSSHIAEQVMRSLNEATGDGIAIPIPCVPLFDGLNQEQILGLSQDEFNDMEKERQIKILKQCAQEVVSLGTTIHALTQGIMSVITFF